MPSEPFASDIRNSLADGERYEDFAYLFDALALMRKPFNEDVSISDGITGKLLCIAFPDKPPQYMAAMQPFRLHFAGVTTKPELKAEFANSVRHAALTVQRPEDIVWQPSLYFFAPTMVGQAGWY
jgi:hypothetical protein